MKNPIKIALMVLLLASLGLSQIKSSQQTPPQTLPKNLPTQKNPPPELAQVSKGTVLKSNIPIASEAYFENTAKVVPPGSGCPNGKVVLAIGQPRPGQIIHRPLVDGSGNIDLNSATMKKPFPAGATRSPATDNQLVRLKDGSLLAIKDSFIWDDVSPNPPEWFATETVTGFGDRKKQRGGVLAFRSTDCGDSWSLHSKLDFATAAGGKYGYPRPAKKDASGNLVADVSPADQGKNPDGSKLWWVGGGDRTELYSCPFTGNLYLTMRVVSGPYKNIVQQSTCLLFYSPDQGKSWVLVKEDLPAWTPIVMTSTPNGRLFLFQESGDKPVVYFSTSPIVPRTKPVISPGYDAYYVEKGQKILVKGGQSVDLFFQAAHPAISRVSTEARTSRVRVAYQAVNASGMQEARVVSIDVQNPNQAPVVTPVAVIRARDAKNSSVMYFNFIDPDYIDMPAGVKTNTSVLYWLEAPRLGLTNTRGPSPRKYAARYVVFQGDQVSSAAHLSVDGTGAPRDWFERADLGDYMSGGFFWRNNTLNYLAQWVEPAGIRANIVTLPFSTNGK